MKACFRTLGSALLALVVASTLTSFAFAAGGKTYTGDWSATPCAARNTKWQVPLRQCTRECVSQGIEVCPGRGRQGLYARHQRQGGSGHARQAGWREGDSHRYRKRQHDHGDLSPGGEVDGSPASCSVGGALAPPRFFFASARKFIFPLQTNVLDCAFSTSIFLCRRVTELGKDMVPKRIFFTKGVGKHRERLTSFELALA